LSLVINASKNESDIHHMKGKSNGTTQAERDPEEEGGQEDGQGDAGQGEGVRAREGQGGFFPEKVPRPQTTGQAEARTPEAIDGR
jgi:hypothetical protein